MNRADRRDLERRIRREASKAHGPVPEVVTLKGGPMDGYVVTPDAPALDPEWYRTWPPGVARVGWLGKRRPGRYTRSGSSAVWEEIVSTS